MISILALYFLCAISFTLSKAVLSYGAPFFFVGVRMIVAGLILLAYSYYQGVCVSIPRKHWLSFFTVIIIHIYIVYMADLWALQYMSSSKSSFIFSLAPFVSALFSYFYFSEKMTPKKLLGLAIGFGAFLPEVYFTVPGDIETQTCGFFSWPEFFMFVSMFASVWGWVLVRDLVKNNRYEPVFINGFGMFFGGIMALITSYYVEQWWVVSPVYNLRDFSLATAAIVVVCNLLFYNFYGMLLKRYTATLLSFAGFLVPIITAVLGWFFLGERVSVFFFASVAAVVVGLYLFYQEDLRQGYVAR